MFQRVHFLRSVRYINSLNTFTQWINIFINYNVFNEYIQRDTMYLVYTYIYNATYSVSIYSYIYIWFVKYEFTYNKYFNSFTLRIHEIQCTRWTYNVDTYNVFMNCKVFNGYIHELQCMQRMPTTCSCIKINTHNLYNVQCIHSLYSSNVQDIFIERFKCIHFYDSIRELRRIQ